MAKEPWSQGWDFKPLRPRNDPTSPVLAFATGPQYVSYNPDKVGDDDGWFLAPDKETMDKVYADARMIAAAPDMYAALKRACDVLAELHANHPGNPWSAREVASEGRSILAKVSR